MSPRENDPEGPSNEELSDGIVKYCAMLATGTVGVAAGIGLVEKPSLVGGGVFVASVIAEVVEFIKL